MRLIGVASTIFALMLTIGILPVMTGRIATASESLATGNISSGSIPSVDEQLWTGVLRMHEAIAAVSPATALAVGLKVEFEALPLSIVTALKAGRST